MVHDSQKQQLDDFLVNVFNTISKLEQAEVKKHNNGEISITEVHILEAIGSEEPKMMSEVAQTLIITVSTLTIAVNKLVQKGYVERFRVEDDRRIVKIGLTEKGKIALEKHRIFHSRMVDTVLRGLEEDEKEVFIKALGNLSAYFKRLFEKIKQ